MSPALRSAALLCALLWPLAAAAAPVEGPVAVLPFTNLNADPSTEFLRFGIAETMVSDLRKSGRVKVVERAQIDQALTELALHGGGATDEATAAKAGHLVGARTVVLGGFQQAGKQLRITARFVTVETGLVQSTAKATGTLEGVFALQDEIVARLLGEGTQAAPVRPRKAASPTVVTAYRLYAMSLATASDADKVGYLKRSLEADPDFSYAVDDLKALEARMAGYSVASSRAATTRAGEMRTALAAETANPQQRSQLAMTLLSGHFNSGHYRALLEDATRLQGQKLEPIGGMNVQEYAEFCIFQAHLVLKHPEQALKAGEHYLREHPAGAYYLSVETQMNALIGAQRDHEERRQKLPALLEEVATRRAAAEKRSVPGQLRSLDLNRCGLLKNNGDYRRAIEECLAFAKQYAADSDARAAQEVPMFRYFALQAHYELGEFKEARALAEQVQADSPDFYRQMSLPVIVGLWPKD